MVVGLHPQPAEGSGRVLGSPLGPRRGGLHVQGSRLHPQGKGPAPLWEEPRVTGWLPSSCPGRRRWWTQTRLHVRVWPPFHGLSGLGRCRQPVNTAQSSVPGFQAPVLAPVPLGALLILVTGTRRVSLKTHGCQSPGEAQQTPEGRATV